MRRKARCAACPVLLCDCRLSLNTTALSYTLSLRGLGSELLPRRFASTRLAGGLFGPCHRKLVLVLVRSRASRPPSQTAVPEDASQLTLENAESRLAHSHPINNERSPYQNIKKNQQQQQEPRRGAGDNTAHQILAQPRQQARWNDGANPRPSEAPGSSAPRSRRPSRQGGRI